MAITITKLIELPIMTGASGGVDVVYKAVLSDGAIGGSIACGKPVVFATQQISGTVLNSNNLGSLDFTTEIGVITIAGAAANATLYIRAMLRG